MTDSTATAPASTIPADTIREKGLAARAVGVIMSPRATYAAITAHPRILGALLTVVILIGAVNFMFLSTEVGQNALLDRQLSTIESFGVKVTDQMMTNMERGVSRAPYFSIVGSVIFLPLMMAVVAGIALGSFNAILGGQATFRQVYAIVVHVGFLALLQVLFATPLNYLRESMSSSTSLAVFLPMVDSGSFLGMLLGSIDLFHI